MIDIKPSKSSRTIFIKKFICDSLYHKICKNSLTSFPNSNKSRIKSVRELHRWPCQNLVNKNAIRCFYVFVHLICAHGPVNLR